jgi:hypothetical protein
VSADAATQRLGIVECRHPPRKSEPLEAGIEPAPERSKRTSWSAFLRAHWGAIAAMDFFTVEVVTWAGLVRRCRACWISAERLSVVSLDR